jgi:glycosyltransferase involved in cell wall biosynthesis
MSRKLHIAILGTRGIPANYGGFETFAEELSTRLVARGHRVTVYGRHAIFKSPGALSPHRGVERVSAPTIMHKYLETPLHALASFINLWWRSYDAVLLCNAANSPFAFLMLGRGMPLLINVDGIERHRSKWNSLGKLWYRLGEWCSVKFGDVMIADAEVIAEYYRAAYQITPAVIAYGSSPTPQPAGETLARFGLVAGKYILYVSRLEPENNALGVIQAYEGLSAELKDRVPLVIVGDAPYADAYKAQLRSIASARVIFTGFQFGTSYQELRSHCMLAVQATEVGGTHPALVEAMAYGNCVIANDVPEHREVLQDTGMYYAKNNFEELRAQMKRLLGSDELRRLLGEKAALHAAAVYSWDKVVDRYEQVFASSLTPSEPNSRAM